MNSNLSSRRSRITVAAILVLALNCGTAWSIGGGGHGGGFGGGHVGGGFGDGHGGGSFGGGHPAGVPPGAWRTPGFSPDRHTFSRFGHGRSTAVFPYLYSPYGSYGFYDPGYPYYAPCDQYSPYYNPEYC